MSNTTDCDEGVCMCCGHPEEDGPDEPEVVKVCRCGESYTREAFNALPIVGGGGGIYDDGEELMLLRNCKCRSTIAIVIGPSLGRAPEDGNWRTEERGDFERKDREVNP